MVNVNEQITVAESDEVVTVAMAKDETVPDEKTEDENEVIIDIFYSSHANANIN